MCGIVAYSGPKATLPLLVNGLSRLEYRGYDSSGVAVVSSEKLFIEKKSGKLSQLKDALDGNTTDGNVGIGHTRWATHGIPNDENAHPHQNEDNKFALVHNGIIENYVQIKEALLNDGIDFTSDTDTEVVAQQLAKEWDGDLLSTTIGVAKNLKGTYALVVVTEHEPDTIVAGRMMSPLVMGIGEGEMFLASDAAAIIEHTNKMVFLENGDFVKIQGGDYKIYNLNQEEIEREVEVVDWKIDEAEKGGHEHYMYKEIIEQPEAIRNTLTDRVDGDFFSTKFGIDRDKALKYNKIWIIACGTAYHAGLFGRELFEKSLGIPVEVELASEFRYRDPIISKDDLGIIISQSGETMDTIAAADLLKDKGCELLGIVNVVGSSLARMSDHIMYLHVGPEIGVASTKAYIGMLTAQLLLANQWDEKSRDSLGVTSADMKALPDLIEKSLLLEDQIKKIAEDIYKHESVYFIGRGLDFSLAAEGALKLKEISYLHAEALPAGELKHGTLALIDDGVPVIVTGSQSSLIEKTVSNVQEVIARGGNVIGIGDSSANKLENICDTFLKLPDAPDTISTILSIIPLQFLAYHVAYRRGESIDQPRNLAKSVTVE